MNKLKRWSYLLLSLVTMSFIAGCGKSEQPVVKEESIDHANGEDRVIALSVSLVEILEKLDVELVGVPNTQYELSEKMQQVTKVGLPMSPDVEMIASLKPTHVLSLTTLESMVKPKLEQAGINATYLNMENIDTLKASITELGTLFNRKEAASKLLADFEADINASVASVKGKEAPRVLILFGFPGSYLAATSESFTGQLVSLLGGTNVVADHRTAYANINLEELLIQKPDIILRMTHGVKEEVLEMFDKEFKENPIWRQFDAVKDGKVYDLDDSLFNVSASLETATALKELAKILYK